MGEPQRQAGDQPVRRQRAPTPSTPRASYRAPPAAKMTQRSQPLADRVICDAYRLSAAVLMVR